MNGDNFSSQATNYVINGSYYVTFLQNDRLACCVFKQQGHRTRTLSELNVFLVKCFVLETTCYKTIRLADYHHPGQKVAGMSS